MCDERVNTFLRWMYLCLKTSLFLSHVLSNDRLLQAQNMNKFAGTIFFSPCLYFVEHKSNGIVRWSNRPVRYTQFISLANILFSDNKTHTHTHPFHSCFSFFTNMWKGNAEIKKETRNSCSLVKLSSKPQPKLINCLAVRKCPYSIEVM